MPNVTTTVDDSSPVFQWLPSSSWFPISSQSEPETSLYFMSTGMTTNSSVANVTFAFAGHSIQIYGSKRENHGSYEVLLDGNVSETVNGSTSSSGGFQQVLFNANGLDDREHFVTVQNLEDGMYLDIDYATWQSNIGDGSEDELIVKTVKDTNPAIEYQGTWGTNPSNLGTFFGGTGHVSAQSGSSIQYSFTGASVALFGPSDPQGASYSVQLDDEPPQNFSFHNLEYMPQSVLYFRGGLELGMRTLKVTLTSTASNGNADAGNMLAIDYMNVFTTPSIEASAPNDLPGATIAGITIGTIAFIALFLITLHFYNQQDKSRTGLRRIFEAGWWRFNFSRRTIVDGVTRVTRRRKASVEKFDLDGGDQYAAVGTSEQEGEYLIPSYGPPGASSGPRLGAEFGEAQNSEALGRLSVHFDAYSDASRSASHSIGGTRHSQQQSSLSGLSTLNQPFIRSRSPTDVGFGNMSGNSIDGGLGGIERQRQLSPPPGSSGVLSTPTPSIFTIPSSPPRPRATSMSPPPGIGSGSPRSVPANIQPFIADARPISYHPQSISEPGPSNPQVPQSPTLKRKRTSVLPLPPGAAMPVAHPAHETNEFGGMTNRASIDSMVSSRAGNRASGVLGPRVRSSTGQRMSFSGTLSPASSEYRPGSVASGGIGGLDSERSIR